MQDTHARRLFPLFNAEFLLPQNVLILLNQLLLWQTLIVELEPIGKSLRLLLHEVFDLFALLQVAEELVLVVVNAVLEHGLLQGAPPLVRVNHDLREVGLTTLTLHVCVSLA